MTTIAQLAAYLATLPQDAEVRVLEEVTSGYSTYASWTDLVLDGWSDSVWYNDHNNTVYLGKD